MGANRERQKKRRETLKWTRDKKKREKSVYEKGKEGIGRIKKAGRQSERGK